MARTAAFRAGRRSGRQEAVVNDLGQARERMIERQIVRRGVRDPNALSAMP